MFCKRLDAKTLSIDSKKIPDRKLKDRVNINCKTFAKEKFLSNFLRYLYAT